MARVKDLWFTTGSRGPKRKTARHPDNGGDPDARRWLAMWTDPDGRERSKAFATQKRAITHTSKMAADVERGDYIDPDAGRVLIEPLADKWLDLREVTAGSLDRYRRCWRLHVKPVFGQRAVASVKPSEVAAWSAGMSKQPATRALALMILQGVFDLAVADGARRDNPVRAKVVGRPEAPPQLERSGWDAARVRLVARACGDYEHVPLIIAGLGLRESEGYGLEVGDFDFELDQVHVRRQLVKAERGYALKLPKGGKTRVVPLPKGVTALVKQAPPTPPVILPWLGEDGEQDGVRSVAPLLSLRGRYIRAVDWARSAWKPALVEAGVIPSYEGRSVTAREHGMHALRHWYSSALQDGGVSLAGVMEFLGHSRKSAPLAVGVYGHVTAQTYDAARQAVDKALFRPRPVTSDGTVTELASRRDAG
jgi:integrase